MKEGTIYKYLDDVHDTDIGSFKVTNGAYYFVYTSYENTDGLYRDLDDVTVLGLLLSISLSGIYLNKKMKKDNKIIKL